jgi:heparan-alpha-glucosaminide N-acetyltransferase
MTIETKISTIRNNSIDTYRGFVMLLMMGEVLELARVAKNYPTNILWQIAGFNQSHVEWVGMSLHDMIQPSFSFLVGVALPYSIASRIKRGQSFKQLLFHTIIRCLVLILLGVFLRSTHRPQTYFTFEDTLSQIGFGFTFLFLVYFAKPRMQWIILCCILFFYWLAWAWFPVTGTPYNWSHNFTGFAAHWNRDTNLGNWVDQWFLNLFPREHPYVTNPGGYLTISFIPTLGTMILGLIAGRWIKSDAPKIPFRKMLITGVVCIAIATVLHYTGICPIVKKVWTPAWTLFSGGFCFLFLCLFGWLVDVKKFTRPATPLIIIGRNSITAYLLADLCGTFFRQSLYIHFGHTPFQIFGVALEPLLEGITLLAIYWSILYWMFRRNIFLRI